MIAAVSIAVLYLVVLGLSLFAAHGIWQIITESPEDEVHRRQQRALKAHHRAMAKDHQKAVSYWKGRGIKPGRVSE